MSDEDILVPQNYDNLSIEDKLKYRENQVKIARDRDIEYVNKITELEFTIKRKEEELAEKNKEIGKLIRRLMTTKYKDVISAQTRPYKELEGKSLYEISQIYLQVRKQVCDEVYQFIMNHWDARMGRGLDCYCNTNGRCDKLKEDLDRIAKGEL